MDAWANLVTSNVGTIHVLNEHQWGGHLHSNVDTMLVWENLEKGVCFSTIELVIRVYGIFLTAEIKIKKKIITLLEEGILDITMNYLYSLCPDV